MAAKEDQGTLGVFLALSLAALIVLPGAGVGQDAIGKVWNIAVGHDWGGHEYIGDDGYIQGFTMELISEVCKAANIQCRTIWDKYTNCMDSEAGRHPYGGQGLQGGWYDACTGWVGSVSRMQIFDFSMPFFAVPQSVFYVKKGRRVDPYDLRNVKAVGFLDGWVSDEKCLARLPGIKGNILPKEKIKHYLTTESIANALIDGTVDVVFSSFAFSTYIPDQIELASKEFFSCTPTGNAMMTRKDNKFNGFWNVGFQQIVANGKFRKMCKEGPEKHGGYGALDTCV